jgi:uncharacterized YccA/Bax inhibitor family protein
MEGFIVKYNNPVFNKLENNEQVFTGEQASYLGITIKTVLLFVIAIAFGLFTMTLADSNPNLFIGILIASFFTGFISIFVAMLNPRLAPIFSVIYAMSEGVALVLISMIYAAEFGGANFVGLAVLVTAGIFFGMLALYTTRLIRVTSRFRRVVLGFGFGIIATILFVSIASFFDGGAMMYTLFGDVNSPLVLFLSLVLIMYGAFMLTLHFDTAEALVSSGMSKQYEWVAALGLMVSIVYIYYQVLRLLAILAARRD